MIARYAKSTLLPVIVILALVASSWPAAIHAQDGAVYLPVISSSAAAGPSFVISSPLNGATVSGTVLFAVQVGDPTQVTQVSFRAGATELGVDNKASDGFQVFLNAKSLPAGPLKLTATASGPGGSATASIDVVVQPNPPSSATLGLQGGVLASAIGSIITVPPNAAPPGTQISVSELTQAQVTTDTNINWDALGVTFLGAQKIQSTAAFSAPLGVSSAGFGARVQPGQAVVNYQILPDADGDGVAEIVVVNTARVAPSTGGSTDVVADAVSQIVLGAVRRVTSSGAVVRAPDAQSLSGPPGATFEIDAGGFNPASAQGNVAIFRRAGGVEARVPALAMLRGRESVGTSRAGHASGAAAGPGDAGAA